MQSVLAMCDWAGERHLHWLSWVQVDSMAEETEGKKKLTAAEALMEPNRAGLSILHLALSSIGTPESQRNALVVLEKAGPAALDSVVRDKKKGARSQASHMVHQGTKLTSSC
jgi:hypothetical protein